MSSNSSELGVYAEISTAKSSTSLQSVRQSQEQLKQLDQRVKSLEKELIKKFHNVAPSAVSYEWHPSQECIGLSLNQGACILNSTGWNRAQTPVILLSGDGQYVKLPSIELGGVFTISLLMNIRSLKPGQLFLQIAREAQDCGNSISVCSPVTSGNDLQIVYSRENVTFELTCKNCLPNVVGQWTFFTITLDTQGYLKIFVDSELAACKEIAAAYIRPQKYHCNLLGRNCVFTNKSSNISFSPLLSASHAYSSQTAHVSIGSIVIHQVGLNAEQINQLYLQFQKQHETNENLAWVDEQHSNLLAQMNEQDKKQIPAAAASAAAANADDASVVSLAPTASQPTDSDSDDEHSSFSTDDEDFRTPTFHKQQN